MSPKTIRVLVVDDSVVIRRLLTDALASVPDIEVVGTASNGLIAQQKIAQLTPDLVTMDVEMPEMDGVTALIELRKRWPKLPVIMFSTLTESGAATTMKALSAGASDYVTKPANVGSMALAQQHVRDELIPRVRALCERPMFAAVPSSLARVPALGQARPSVTRELRGPPIELVAIGVSTGGPNALAALLPSIPANFPVPIVITQHMPPIFTRMLAERLSAASPIKYKEGARGASLTPGSGWIAPGDYHMEFEKSAGKVNIRLTQSAPEQSCRPAVDVMLRSAMHAYGARVLTVILTGMGKDGLRGAHDLKKVGGAVIAQDQASSVVWGMPGYVANAGIADAVLPLNEIAKEIIRRVSHGRGIPRRNVA